MQLHEMQNYMFAQIRKPLDVKPLKHVADFIKSTPTLDAHARLEIYRRSYWYRLIDAFYDDFPGLLTILGEKAFDRLTQSYLDEHPSRSFSLRDLGQFLELWLLRNPTIGATKHAICRDMVALEWAHIEAFDSVESPVLSLNELCVAGAELQMALQPHLRLLTLTYPVDDVRLDAKALPDALLYDGETIHLAVYRYDSSVYYKRLSPEEYLILFALKRGETLGEAIETGFRKSQFEAEEQAIAVKESFDTWMRLGWLCRREKC